MMLMETKRGTLNAPPLFSIITVCRNAEVTIGDTINSLLNQSYQNYEYLVIDGKSTDHTLQIVEKYGEQISKVVSEPDEGIYDAMNKGLRLAKGQYVYFLNSGDSFIDRFVLEDIATFIVKNNMPDIVFGNSALWRDGRFIQVQVRRNCEVIDIFFLPVNHQAVFMKLSSVNGFDTSLKILADYDLFLRIWLAENSRLGYAHRFIANYDLGGVSLINKEKLIQEYSTVRKRYFGNIWIRLLLLCEGTRLFSLVRSYPIRMFLNKVMVKKGNHSVRVSNVE